VIRAWAAFGPKGNLEPFEYDPGPLGPDEVEIEVLYCGLCRGDMNVIDNLWGRTKYPVVPGHEVVGRIVQRGQNVTQPGIGQLVGLGWHAGFCNACEYCRAGEPQLCTNAQATIIGHNGGFADKVRAASNAVVPLQEGGDPESAGPLFCAGIAVFAPLLELQVSPSARVAVIGVGGLGHLAVQFLRAWGCEVTAFTSTPSKREEVLRLGAHRVLDSGSPGDLAAVKGQFDLILSTASARLDWDRYLNALKPHGRLHFVGTMVDALDIHLSALVGGRRAVSGSMSGSPEAMGKMLAFCSQHNIRPQVETYSFDAINEALARMRAGAAHYRIVLCR
jgi:uncharacterized zinc-type alcohol dehydrogenase-like protein